MTLTKLFPADAAPRYHPRALGVRKRNFPHGPRVRTRGSRLRHFRLGEATLEPFENRRSRTAVDAVLLVGESGRLRSFRIDREIWDAGRLCFGDARRRLPRPFLRQGGDDRLLRQGEGTRSQSHLQTIRPSWLRLLHRYDVRL